MVALYLVQHGRSLPKERDPEQSLSGEGISEVKTIAGVARNYGVAVGLIAHSGKRRALETAEILAEALAPARGVSSWTGLSPLDDVTTVASAMDAADNLMLVGHLPFLSRLASRLITGDAEKEVFAFQNGGIVCLEHRRETGSWVIVWTLMPRIGDPRS